MGALIVEDDGMVRFRRRLAVFGVGTVQPLRGDVLEPGEADSFKGVARERAGEQVAFTSNLPGSRKVNPHVGKVLRAAGPELLEYRRAVQGLAFQELLSALPGHLDDLWYEGAPLPTQGGEHLATMQARRAAVLDYWAGRASSPEGQAVCKAVEVWLEEVVQPSKPPVRLAEQQRANAAARHDRRLDVVAR